MARAGKFAAGNAYADCTPLDTWKSPPCIEEEPGLSKRYANLSGWAKNGDYLDFMKNGDLLSLSFLP
jgi:hypothetical protein